MRISNLTSMLLLQLLLIIIVSAGNSFAKQETISGAFGKREEYKHETQLGNPAEIKDMQQNQGDTTNLKNLSSGSLVSNGNNELRGSKDGHFLQNSEQKKIDAAEEFKINPENSWLKDSLKIEANPIAKTGGGESGVSSSETAIEIKKSCTEGVDFNIDVGYELKIDSKEEEYLGPVITTPKTILLLGSESPCHSVKLWKRHFRYFVSNTIENTESVRTKIIEKLKVNSESIGKNISFPTGGKGEGHIEQIEPKGYRWQNYKFGYDELSQEKLKRFIINEEYWQVATTEAEELVSNNECYETKRVCLKNGDQTFLNGYKVTRPCWYERVSYRCTSAPKDGCDYLVKQNCRLENSACEHQVGSICMRWRRNFTCAGKKKQLNYSAVDSGIFCLGGECHTPTIEKNPDFSNVAYLAVLNAAKDDCSKDNTGICKDPITIFPGEISGCKNVIASAINCCSSMKGWAKGILCKCSGEEKALSLKREKGNCHKIGTYCSKKMRVTKACLVKKTNYCCFSSKLARIFHEQARLQGILDWGSAKNPNCRALTLEEFTRIDFSKINLEELFDNFLSLGKNNMSKSLPSFIPNKTPDIQKQHMDNPNQNNQKNSGGGL